MYCEEISKSKFSCLREKARFSNTAFIRGIRKKYLSYFRFRLSWKKGYISSYHRVFYYCPTCLKSFIKKGILDFHMKSCWLDDGKEHKNEQSHMCPFCGKLHVSLLALKRHERRHKERQVPALKSNYQLLGNAESQNQMSKWLRKFSCPYCHNSFTQKSFAVHKKHNQKSLGESHQCPLCGLHFLYLCQFIEHSLIHEGIERNLKKQVREKLQRWVVRGSCEFLDCRICGKSFRTLNEVIGHIEDHLKKIHDIKREQKNVSFDLLLGNKSWQKAALLQFIEDMKPRKPFVEHSNITEKHKKVINLNSNIAQKSVSCHKNLTKSSDKEKNSINHTNGFHSENEVYVEMLPQSIQNSGISEKDILDTACPIRPKSPEIKWPSEAVNDLCSSSKSQIAKHVDIYSINQGIDSLSDNSQEISTSQKDFVCKIYDAKTVPRNTSENISKDSDLLKDRKEDSLVCSDASVNNESLTCNVNVMNDVAGKDYTQFIQADSNRIYESKSASEVIYQSRDNSTNDKNKYLKCPACHAYFEKAAFSIHVSIHRKDGWYICCDCGLSFWCLGNLEEHCLSNHPKEADHSKKVAKFVRNAKKRITKSKKKKQSKTNPRDKKYHCSVCNSGYINWKDFLDHVFQQKNVEKCIAKVTRKNKAVTIPDEKKYYCAVCDSGYRDWKDFLDHVFAEKRGGIHCSKYNTSCMDENQKSLLKRANKEYFHNEKLISKWRNYFQIDREVKVLVESMTPCTDCGEYYGTTEEDHQKHQMIHAESKSQDFIVT